MWRVPVPSMSCGAVALACACVCACAPGTPRATSPESPSDDSNQDVPRAEAETSGNVKVDGGRSSERDHPLLDEREPEPEAALPRLNYKHLGMHIGGESNSADSKTPWFKDIERYEDEILSCYRWVDEPQKGGSYGVDLYVSTQGGPPEVRGSRQKLGSESFDACMRQAFSAIDFHRPERPTVFSYSLFFELEE